MTAVTADDDIESAPVEDPLQKRRGHRKQALKKAETVKYYQPSHEEREDKDGRKIKVLYCVKCNVDV